MRRAVTIALMLAAGAWSTGEGTIGALMAGVPLYAQAAAGQQPPPVVPAPTPVPPGGPPQPAPPSGAREFTAPAGLIFNTVRPERVEDFEKVIAYLQAALAKSKDQTIAAQAKGWKVFKASEPGPNGTVLYVFVIDPAVPGAEYGLGRILADAYPDPVQLQEIWKLYTSSVTSGGTLLNLTPSHPPLPPPSPAPVAPGTPPPGAPAGAPPADDDPARAR